MKLVVYWYLLLAVHGISARLCGFPGKPTNGDFAPRKQFYEQGEHVTYTCDKGYYSNVGNRDVKEAQRFCQCHGVWNGTVPTCNFYDSVDERYLTTTFQSENLQRISDEDDSTCARLQFSDNKKEKDITADLRLTSNTTSVTMIVGNIENDPGKITATVKIKQIGTSMYYWQDCEVSKPISSHMSLNFICDDITNSDTQLKIVFGPTDALLNNTKISICTLRATTITNTTCGEPEIPFHGDVGTKSQSSRTKRAQYKCLDGYLLLGDVSSICIRKGTAYFWQSSKPPICISERDRECKVLPEIQNGRLIISMPDCEEDYSFKDLRNTAVLQCDPGYTLQSPKQMAYCNELTNWTWSFDSKSPINSTECVLTMKQGKKRNRREIGRGMGKCRSRKSDPFRNIDRNQETQETRIGSLLSVLDERIIMAIIGLASLVIFIGLVYCFYMCCRKKPGSSVIQRSETADPVYENVSTRPERVTNRSSYYLKYFRHRPTVSQSIVGDNTYVEIDSVVPSNYA